MTRNWGLTKQQPPILINPEAPLDAPFEGWPDYRSEPFLVHDTFVTSWVEWAKMVIAIICVFLVVFALMSLLSLHFFAKANAKDNGQYTNNPLKQWFDQLASGKGLCCSFADGVTVKDVDWDTKDGKYRVNINNVWIDVPDAAVVKEPNRFGPAVVWPYQDQNGVTQIRCFLPGAES
jgi:hypothetical protein